jgi:hypothetical protein
MSTLDKKWFLTLVAKNARLIKISITLLYKGLYLFLMMVIKVIIAIKIAMIMSNKLWFSIKEKA